MLRIGVWVKMCWYRRFLIELHSLQKLIKHVASIASHPLESTLVVLPGFWCPS